MMYKVIAVILNYNSSDDTEKCIKYLLRQEYDLFDILVVDNFSLPQEREKVEAFCSLNQIPLICNNLNNGYSAGNNKGMRFAAQNGADAVLIINPDVEIHDTQFLSKLMKALFGNEQIAVVGSDIVDVNGNHQNPLRELRYWEELFWPVEIVRKKLFSRYGYTEYDNRSKFAEKLSGCCFLIKTSILDRIEYLDEKVFLYCEESILSRKIQKCEMKMFYTNETTAYHMHLTSKKGSRKKRFEIMIESRKYYLTQYSNLSGILLRLLIISKELQKRFYKILLR